MQQPGHTTVVLHERHYIKHDTSHEEDGFFSPQGSPIPLRNSRERGRIGNPLDAYRTTMEEMARLANPLERIRVLEEN